MDKLPACRRLFLGCQMKMYVPLRVGEVKRGDVLCETDIIAHVLRGRVSVEVSV